MKVLACIKNEGRNLESYKRSFLTPYLIMPTPKDSAGATSLYSGLSSLMQKGFLQGFLLSHCLFNLGLVPHGYYHCDQGLLL